MSALLAVENLRLEIPGRDGKPLTLLDGVDLEVEAGGCLGLVGESGSGKSLTALTILGLPPRRARVSGSVRLEGRELLGLPEREVRGVRGAGVAMIFQEPLSALNPIMAIGDQVAEGLTLRGVPKGEALRRARSALDRVGLGAPRFSDRLYPHQLSGGQRQRVTIAIALAMRPKLLIADEPTTALDVVTQAGVLALLQDVALDTGMAVLLVTHDLGVVAAMAGRVTVLYCGRVAEAGPVEAVFARPLHRYTQALIGTLPVRGEASPIPGTVPDPTARPAGCPFHPRCGFASERCVAKVPTLAVAGRPPHRAACFHPPESRQR